MQRVLVVGYNAWDVVCPVPGVPAPDEKVEVREIVTGGGGPGATAAVALARLGAEVRLVTPLTDDAGGRMQREELVEAGVDISRSVVLPGYDSARAVILVDSKAETRTVLWSRGDLPRLDAALFVQEWLDGIDVVHIDGHEPPLSMRVVSAARAAGIPVVMDAGSVRPDSRELVGACSDVISSATFAPELAGCSDVGTALRRLKALGPPRVAMTFGAAGSVALVDDELVHVPAWITDVVDTTGAGDAFHAGYSFALAQGRPWLDRLDFGSAVAALKCRRWGGRAGLPTEAETEELLRNGRRRADKPDAVDIDRTFA